MQQQLDVLQFAISWFRLVGRQFNQLLPLSNLRYLLLFHIANLAEQLDWGCPTDNHPWVDIGCALFDFVLLRFGVANQLATCELSIRVKCEASVLFLLKIILESLLLSALEFLIVFDISFDQPVLFNNFKVRHSLLLV
jgi:hypothetical protein